MVKLLSKITNSDSFTPCEGDRILGKDNQSKLNLIDAGIKKMEAEEIESGIFFSPMNQARAS